MNEWPEGGGTTGCVLPGLQQSVQLNGAQWRREDFGGQGEPLILRGRYQVKPYVHRSSSCKWDRSVNGRDFFGFKYASSPCPFLVKTQDAMPLMSSLRMQL